MPVGAWLAAGVTGCSLALDFGPGVLLPPLDAGTDVPVADAAPDVPPADVPPADVPPADVPPADVPPADVPPADVGKDAGVVPCAAGWGDCDGAAANGCETDLSRTAAHCGACARACLGAMTCTNGACGGGRCAPPNVECGVVCVDLQSDPRNCGACGVACGVGASRCCQGACMNPLRCL